MSSAAKAKIFCIGFHKTGTKSLAAALRQLGYSVTGPNGVWNPNIARDAHRIADKLVKRFDAFQDNPWPLLYKELDRDYPGSRFILSVRSPASWIDSLVRYFGEDESPTRRWIYGVGTPRGNEAVYLERFERHNREVLAHFKDRPDDLLVMDIGQGDGWEKLCPFLGNEIPDTPFPHSNRTEDLRAETGLRKWKREALFLAVRLKDRFII
jgi:hypothetical protein